MRGVRPAFSPGMLEQIHFFSVLQPFCAQAVFCVLRHFEKRKFGKTVSKMTPGSVCSCGARKGTVKGGKIPYEKAAERFLFGKASSALKKGDS